MKNRFVHPSQFSQSFYHAWSNIQSFLEVVVVLVVGVVSAN